MSRQRLCDGSVSDTFLWVSESTLSQVLLPMFLLLAINRGLNMHFRIRSYLKMLTLNVLFLHSTLMKVKKRVYRIATGISFSQMHFSI